MNKPQLSSRELIDWIQESYEYYGMTIRKTLPLQVVSLIGKEVQDTSLIKGTVHVGLRNISKMKEMPPVFEARRSAIAHKAVILQRRMDNKLRKAEELEKLKLSNPTYNKKKRNNDINVNDDDEDDEDEDDYDDDVDGKSMDYSQDRDSDRDLAFIKSDLFDDKDDDNPLGLSAKELEARRNLELKAKFMDNQVRKMKYYNSLPFG